MTNFKLELAEVEERHQLNFNTYEEGKFTLEEYLGRVVFYQAGSWYNANNHQRISTRQYYSPLIHQGDRS